MKKFFALSITFILLFFVGCANTTGQNAHITSSLVFDAIEKAVAKAEKVTASRAKEIAAEFELEPRDSSTYINNLFETKDGTVKIIVKETINNSIQPFPITNKIDFIFNNFSFSESENNNDYAVKISGHVQSTVKVKVYIDEVSSSRKGDFRLRSVNSMTIDADSTTNPISGLLSFDVKATASMEEINDGVITTGKINGKDIRQEVEFDILKLRK